LADLFVYDDALNTWGGKCHAAGRCVMELQELMEVLRHLAGYRNVNRLVLAEIRIGEYLQSRQGIARQTAIERLRDAIRAEPKEHALESEFWRLVADSNSLRTAVLTGSRTPILMIADSCR
jgi:hypothetical protein